MKLSIRIVVVDDSAVLRQSTRLILESDPGLQVIGEASNGAEAVSLVNRLQPDLITMDVRMPKMDGLQAIEQIMSENPLPIIVVTSLDLTREMEILSQATKLGAVAVLQRPESIAVPEFRIFASKLIEQVKLMNSIKVVHRFRRKSSASNGDLVWEQAPKAKPEIIAIGSSTGGPAALHKILSELPADLTVPIVIVQHISFGFVEGLAQWLDAASPLTVRVAQNGEKLEPGVVYIAPDNYHMLVDRFSRVVLDTAEPINGHRPSVTALFKSTARSFGAATLAVLLTGMGNDGASGMKSLSDAGAITIAQDEKSCVVFGMPKEAIALGAARRIVPLDQIPRMLRTLTEATVIA